VVKLKSMRAWSLAKVRLREGCELPSAADEGELAGLYTDYILGVS